MTNDTAAALPSRERRPRGQVLVLFALLLTFLLGTAAFVVDLAWIWVNELKVQRAADAAALAGVVFLPGNIPGANTSAHEESRKNGYQDGDGSLLAPNGGIDVYPRPDPADPRRMLVTVSTPIETFFMQVFGFDQVQVTRDSKAEFILPVPMGSPENYYGVFGQIRTPSGGVWQGNAPAVAGPRTSAGVISSSTTSTSTSPTDNAGSCATTTGVTPTIQWGQFPAPGAPAASTLDDRVNSSNNQWIRSETANNRVCLGNLGFALPANPANPPAPAPAYPGHRIAGIEVRIEGFATESPAARSTST